mmetsp:Transcript_47760/g.112717  ORF Transcript_47760/g.112717 Transcript_47760/m.112717 type:complete len:90 (+) Transcript_47760:2338-2607(+)
MIIAKKQKLSIYTQLFRDGVLVVKQERKNEKKINFIIIKLMKSLVSKGLVKEQFSWRFYYFTLKEEGIKFLRNYLHLPENVFPLTYKQI